MAIEGLKNIYGIPPVKKEQEPGMNQRNKQRKDLKKRRKKVEESQLDTEGKIDIRV